MRSTAGREAQKYCDHGPSHVEFWIGLEELTELMLKDLEVVEQARKVIE